MSQLNLLAHARAADPETSHRAAASVTPTQVADSCQAVALVLRLASRPLTDHEIVERATHYFPGRFSDSRLRTARAELARVREVRMAGLGRSPSGRAARTWEIAS